MAAWAVVSACAVIMTVDKTSFANCLGILPNILYVVVIIGSCSLTISCSSVIDVWLLQERGESEVNFWFR